MTGAQVGNLALLYGTTLLMSLGQGMVFPTIPLLASSFDVSAGLAVQVVTAHALGRTVSLIPAGLLIDRYGTRTAMLAGGSLVLSGAWLTAATPYLGLLFLGQFLAGVGESVWTMGREVSGVQSVAQDQRGRLLSGFMGVKSAGMAIGPVAGGVIAEWAGFRTVFAAYAGGAALVLLTSLLSRKDAARGAVGKLSWWGKVSDVAPGLRPTFLLALLGWTAWRCFREPLEQPFQPRHAFPEVVDAPAYVAYFQAYAAHLLAHGPLAGNDDGRQGDGGSDDGQDDGRRGYEVAPHGSTLPPDRGTVKVENCPMVSEHGGEG